LGKLSCFAGPAVFLELFKGSFWSPFNLERKSNSQWLKQIKTKDKAIEANVEI
jgi:hypothetical protein